MLTYDIATLLDRMEASGKVDDTALAQLEWAYMVLLEHYRPPKHLHRALAEDPALFCEILTWIYKAHDEEDREITEEGRVRAERGYDLLKSWRLAPGSDAQGRLDAGRLNEWVFRARELAQASGRGAIGDQTIGQVLCHAPLGSDQVWPHEAVRDLLEDLASKDLEIGLYLAVRNARGITSRAVGEGGDQERELVRKYRDYAEKLSDEWPRTARVMGRIAAQYESDARQWDIEAEMDQDSR